MKKNTENVSLSFSRGVKEFSSIFKLIFFLLLKNFALLFLYNAI